MTRSLYLFAFAVFALPGFVTAHETHLYEIGGVEYEIVVGSRNEPVIVDDKTGVDLEIVRNGKLFTEAHNMLQVEMIAGDKRKTESLQPVWGEEGKYKTNYIATVPTTISYRFFGTLENIPFDVTYTCNPAGHPASVENTERKEVSAGIIETLSRGNFGCPQPKEAFGFPEEAASLVALTEADRAPKVESTKVEEQRDKDKKRGGFGCLASSVLAGSALLLSIAALLASRKKKTLDSVTVKPSGE